MDGAWWLSDFGATVRVGDPIGELTQQFAPLPKLKGKPARPQYDWHMLAVALAVGLYPDTWREVLLANEQQGTYAPIDRLRAAIQSATTCTELKTLFERILGKCTG